MSDAAERIWATTGMILTPLVLAWAITLSIVLAITSDNDHRLDQQCYPMHRVATYYDGQDKRHAICVDADGGLVSR